MDLSSSRASECRALLTVCPHGGRHSKSSCCSAKSVIQKPCLLQQARVLLATRLLSSLASLDRMEVISLNFSSRRSALLLPVLFDSNITDVFSQGYEVHGVKRHASTFNQSRIEHLFMQGLDQKIHTGSGDALPPLRLHMHYGDVLDINSLVSVFIKVKPDEIYNLAAQSHVRTSFDMPV